MEVLSSIRVAFYFLHHLLLFFCCFSFYLRWFHNKLTSLFPCHYQYLFFIVVVFSKTMLGGCTADLASHGCHLLQLLCHSPRFPRSLSGGPGVHAGKLDTCSSDCHIQCDGFHRQVADIDSCQMVPQATLVIFPGARDFHPTDCALC